MKYITFVVSLLLSTLVMAADPADYLRVHLAEMEKHLAVMQRYEGGEYQCTDLVEHARQMTLHMEQMTQMMTKMHQVSPDHEMDHKSEE